MALGIRKNGMDIIKKNVGKFQSIVDGLDKGITLCSKEISTNEKTIKTLTDKNNTIEESKEQAIVFQTNLKSMLELPKKQEEEKQEEKED